MQAGVLCFYLLKLVTLVRNHQDGRTVVSIPDLMASSALRTRTSRSRSVKSMAEKALEMVFQSFLSLIEDSLAQ